MLRCVVCQQFGQFDLSVGADHPAQGLTDPEVNVARLKNTGLKHTRNALIGTDQKHQVMGFFEAILHRAHCERGQVQEGRLAVCAHASWGAAPRVVMNGLGMLSMSVNID